MNSSDRETKKWLAQLICDALKIPNLRPFQEEHAFDLYCGRDVFLTIATGQGKTAVLLSPLLAARAKGESGIGLAIVPTKVLAQQLEKTANGIGIAAFAVTEDTLRDSPVNLFQLVKEKPGVRLAVMSPQMLTGARFRAFSREKATRDSIRWVLVDEAHLVLEESSTFCSPYRDIVHMRSSLPSTSVWCAVTGSLTPANTNKALRALGFNSAVCINRRYSLDRPNVKYIPRITQHPTSTGQYLDLAFPYTPFLLISSRYPNHPHIYQHYCDLPLDNALYNSLMPLDYRQKFVEEMASGTTLRIGIVTDSLTYGLDIPNITCVVIFDLCPSPENMKQKMGRPGRDGSPATVITFAPPWVQEVPLNEIQSQKDKDDLKRRNTLPKMLLNWFNPTLANCPRVIDNEYYGDAFTQQDGCCIVCSPTPENTTHFALVQKWKDTLEARSKTTDITAKLPRSDGKMYRVPTQAEKDQLKGELLSWRTRTWNTARQATAKDRNTPAEIFLPKHILDSLVNHAHACSTFERFKLIAAGWKNLELRGQILYEFLTEKLVPWKKLVDGPGTMIKCK
ncbi:hypothetical protein NMY22_g17518 [Coprinellus aureogranulatus]|nr:hypothetical protein NMY22_g17518 [Coprinellus aureogranulatus]